MRLTSRQISAGMALAGMTQEELATLAGIARPTLNRILNEEALAKEDTLQKIRHALEARSVEFLEQSGVRLKLRGVDMLIGQEGLQQFFTNVYEHARQNGGTIVQFGVDENKFLNHLGNEFSQSYMSRMAQVAKERKDLIVKAIICEGDRNFLASEYNEYRWISANVFQAVPFYIYGETLAIIDFQTIPAPTILVIKHAAITNAYRKQFDAFWQLAQSPEISNLD